MTMVDRFAGTVNGEPIVALRQAGHNAVPLQPEAGTSC
jgi:hypothetical protein